ncbi:MAG: single-stranded-DNA-specific exonuclease RecJ [Legionellales bacterium]|nr:single-stranded-DNA-specific exonuclease RecJ [Legionellales bacterium]
MTALTQTPELLQRIYAARGITTHEQLQYQLAHLIPYYQLSDIEPAVDLLVDSLQHQRRIMIIGDFDADGATSSALAVLALQACGAQHVQYLVPNRFDFGYGLTPEIVQVAAEQWQPDVLVTVDNGITSVAGVELANQLGMKVLITDHHLPGEQLPLAHAIVNPNRIGDAFASKYLAGVGVIFYVMLALRRRLVDLQWFAKQGLQEPNMGQFLDLVALGTVADVVPLDHNNRILVQQGLQRIRAGSTRPGILALLTIANRNPQQLQASDLAFAVAPRLNAAGRLQDMAIGIACLITDDADQAQQYAQQLDELNQQRRHIEAQMQQQAMDVLQRLSFDPQALPMGLCLYDPAWHQGVIGILAGRLKEKFHRPVIVFAQVDAHELKGSARSIAGLHIRDLLARLDGQYPGLMTKFGGHAMAAGLSLPTAHWVQFQQAFITLIEAQLTPADLTGEILSDGSLSVEQLTLATARLLQNSGPWGQQFPEPLFDGVFQVVNQLVLGDKHLKLTLRMRGSSLLMTGMVFNVDRSQWPNPRCRYIHAAFRLSVNDYQGLANLQLIIEHLTVVEGEPD